MKKLTILLALAYCVSMQSQLLNQPINVNVTTSKKKDASDYMNDNMQAASAYGQAAAAAKQASAAQAQAQAARAAAMSEPSIEIIQPLEVDLGNYTHIALVKYTLINGYGKEITNKQSYKLGEEALQVSRFEIVNPFKVKRVSAKKNPTFLRQEKNPNWLYLYHSLSLVGVDVQRTTIVKDYQENTLFSMKSINSTSNLDFLKYY